MRITQRRTVADVAIIIGAWAGFLALVAVMHLLRQGPGFDVWPLGEDRNWIDMLQRGDAIGTARFFWAVDGRNPLSAWWYIALKPLILGWEPALLFIRYAMGLALALSAYVLMRSLMGEEGRRWQVGVAAAIALSMANAYFDNIFWPMQGALVVSITCVVAYVQFVRGGRRSIALYGVALILWFLAFASYSLQCGAIAAILYVALRHPPERKSATGRFMAIMLEVAPFGALFVLFVLVWQTSTSGTGFGLDPTRNALVTSLKEGLWHEDISLMTLVLQANAGRYIFAAGAAILAMGVSLALWPRAGSARNLIAGRTALVDLLVVTLCLALPTIAIEASNPTWGPGSRWRMIYQFTNPVFHLGIVALLVSLLPAGSALRRGLWTCVLALYLGAATTLSLAHNAKQVEWAASEKLVFQHIRSLILDNYQARDLGPLHIVLRAGEGLLWRSSGTLNRTYMRSWFGTNDVTLTIVHPLDNAALMAPGPWPAFQPDGIALSQGEGRPAVVVPYARVHVLFGGKDGIIEPAQFDKADFRGFAAEWQRTEPFLRQMPVAAMTCPSTWLAGDPVMARGLSPVAENGPDGSAFRWSIAKSSRLLLPNLCGEARKLRIVAGGAIDSRNLDGLRARVNGRAVALGKIDQRPGEIVYEAELPQDGPLGREVQLALDVPVTASPGGGDPRTLGIMIRQIGFDR